MIETTKISNPIKMIQKKCLFLAIMHNDNNHIAKNEIVQVMSKTLGKDFQYEILLINNQVLSTKDLNK